MKNQTGRCKSGLFLMPGLNKSALAFVVLLALNPGVAGADAIININAATNQFHINPVAVFLEAGDYVAQSIGISQGGAYDAWNPYGSGANWMTYFAISSASLGDIGNGAGCCFATPSIALGNTNPLTFSLVSDETVYFSVLDSFYGDNIGGSSVRLTHISAPVPEPETFAMLLAGLGILGAAARRRKQTAV